MSTELEIVKTALRSPRVRDLEEVSIQKPIGALIARVYALKGANLAPEDLRFMANELARSVKERFPGLSVEEVGIALDKGVKGDYGEYFGLSVITFLSWLRSYQESGLRSTAQDEIAPKAIAQTRTITERELRIMERENALDSFKRYKAGHRPLLPVVSARTYDSLVSLGMISDTKEEKLRAMEEAKAIKKEEIVVDRLKKTYILSRSIDKLSNVLSQELTETNPGLIIRAKEVLLLRYFDRLIKAKKELSDIYPKP